MQARGKYNDWLTHEIRWQSSSLAYKDDVSESVGSSLCKPEVLTTSCSKLLSELQVSSQMV